MILASESTTFRMNWSGSGHGKPGSAINDTIREVGGALGIAIVGSLSAALFRSHLGSTLSAAPLPHRVTDLATSSVAAADAVGRQVGGAAGGELVSAAHSAFVTAMATGMRVAAAVALVAAIAAIVALPRRHHATPAVVPSAGTDRAAPVRAGAGVTG